MLENSNRNILIIEDSEDHRFLVKKALEKDENHSYQFLESDNPQNGLELVKKAKPDCILLDYSFPKGNGIDFIKTLNDRFELIPAIVMITGQGNEEVAAECFKQGALDYIVKDSLTHTSIIRSVNNAIEKNRLKEQIQEQQEEIRQKNSELEEANQHLQEFSHTVAHDLKSPLSHIQSYLMYLQENRDEDITEIIGKSIESAGRMSQLIDDILKFAKNTRKPVDIVDIDLNEIAQRVKEDLSNKISEAKATIHIETLPHILGNLTQMYQVFLNLMTNAIKFRDPERDPVIRIHSRYIEREEFSDHHRVNICRIYIEDNGIGIEDQYKSKIFKGFERLHSQEEYEGTGIGLATVKKIVALHCGSIQLESEVDKGSTFIISMPINLNQKSAAFLRKEIREVMHELVELKATFYHATRPLTLTVLDKSSKGMRCSYSGEPKLDIGQLIELENQKKFEVRWIKDHQAGGAQIGLKLLA